LLLQKSGSLNHHWQIQPNFFPAAAREQGDPLFLPVEPMRRGKFFARYLRRWFVGQRMSHIADLNAVPRIKLLLKGEDHNHLADIFFDLLHSSGAPGPDLWTHKVEHRNAPAMQFTRQAQIEIREVDQDGGVRLAARGFGHQVLEAAANVRQVLYDLNQPDHGDIFGVDQQLAAGGAHLFSAHAEESGAGGKPAQRVNKLRTVGIA
jgi:hypothetical protein